MPKATNWGCGKTRSSTNSGRSGSSAPQAKCMPRTVWPPSEGGPEGCRRRAIRYIHTDISRGKPLDLRCPIRFSKTLGDMNLAHEAQGTMNREKLYSSRQREPSRSGVSLLSQMGAFGALGPCGQCLHCDLGLVPGGLVPEIAGRVEERRLHTPFGSRLSTQRRSQFP